MGCAERMPATLEGIIGSAAASSSPGLASFLGGGQALLWSPVDVDLNFTPPHSFLSSPRQRLGSSAEDPDGPGQLGGDQE